MRAQQQLRFHPQQRGPQVVLAVEQELAGTLAATAGGRELGCRDLSPERQHQLGGRANPASGAADLPDPNPRRPAPGAGGPSITYRHREAYRDRPRPLRPRRRGHGGEPHQNATAEPNQGSSAAERHEPSRERQHHQRPHPKRLRRPHVSGCCRSHRTHRCRLQSGARRVRRRGPRGRPPPQHAAIRCRASPLQPSVGGTPPCLQAHPTAHAGLPPAPTQS